MTPPDDLRWEPGPVAPVLPLDEVHVWRAALDQPNERVRRLLGTLSADERARADKFYFERHRRPFIVSRGFLRAILGRYLDREPESLVFTYGPQGKPALGETDLHFNLSHSGDCALLALTRGREIGVDVERVRPRAELEGIAGRFFAPAEVAALRAVSAVEKEQAFFNCWTRKEAYVKACGEGLARPLDRFEVSLAPGEAARLIAVADDAAEAARWALRELESLPGYVGCVAVPGHGWRLRCWRWHEQE
jgi:4'-phosphopantetheinyl transferase